MIVCQGPDDAEPGRIARRGALHIHVAEEDRMKAFRIVLVLLVVGALAAAGCTTGKAKPKSAPTPPEEQEQQVDA